MRNIGVSTLIVAKLWTVKLDLELAWKILKLTQT